MPLTQATFINLQASKQTNSGQKGAVSWISCEVDWFRGLKQTSTATGTGNEYPVRKSELSNMADKQQIHNNNCCVCNEM
jgi:hypothetical protein